MKNQIILLDLDGTIYELPEGGFLKSSVYRDMRKRSIYFLSKKLKLSLKKSEAIYEDILVKYHCDLSIGFEKDYGIDRMEYFNYAWDMDASKHLKKDKLLQEILQDIGKRNTLVVLSDAPQIWIKKVLQLLEIQDLFEEIFGGEGDSRKISGQFEKIISQFNADTSKMFMIGDTENTDVIEPKKYGIKTILVGKNFSSEADFNIEEIYKIKDIFNENE